MRTIIVPTDFSDTAYNAAQYAVEMAIEVKAEIVLVNTVVYPLVAPEVSAAAGTFEVIFNSAKADMDQFRAKLEKYAAGEVTITSEVIVGDAIDEVKNIAEVKKPYAIVMGIQGAGTTARLIFGSTAFRAMHELLFPVYLIPPHVRYRAFKHIGLACDLADAADTINAAGIAALVNEYHASLDILYVSKPGKMNAGEVLPESKNLLNDLQGLHPEFHYSANGDTVAAITDFVKERPLDLLVVVPGRRNFFSNIFHKSVSNRIATQVSIPILSLHK